MDDDTIRKAVDAMCDHIVNPRCDECGVPVTPADKLAGPHLCVVCENISQARFQQRFRDYLSQERPRGRRIHVVKLPEGFKW